MPIKMVLSISTIFLFIQLMLQKEWYYWHKNFSLFCLIIILLLDFFCCLNVSKGVGKSERLEEFSLLTRLGCNCSTRICRYRIFILDILLT